MPNFSLQSMQRLAECDIRLQKVFCKLVEVMDVTVLCGHRGEIEQERAVAIGTSKVHFPDSKHNSLPSKAVDVAPYFPTEPHIRWDDKEAFTYMAGITKGIATSMGVQLRWGGDWDQDNDQRDEKGLRDLPHFEVVEGKKERN